MTKENTEKLWAIYFPTFDTPDQSWFKLWKHYKGYLLEKVFTELAKGHRPGIALFDLEKMITAKLRNLDRAREAKEKEEYEFANC